MTHKKMSKKLISIFSLILVFMVSFTLIGGTEKSYQSIKKGVLGLFSKNDDNTPMREKVLKDNGDGTFNLSLNVTGDSEKIVNKANVIVIIDRSGSMNTSETYNKYTETTSTSGTQYGLVNGSYVQLTRHGSSGSYYYTYNDGWFSQGPRYDGIRYTRESVTETRMAAAKNAVNNLANALLSNNGKDGNPADTIEMALVSFATTASVDVTKTTNYNGTGSDSKFKSAVDSLSADGGTNWEDALQKANSIKFDNDGDATYVIFVSDGNPTFRNTKGNYNPMDDYWYSGRWNNGTYISGVYGNGSDSSSINNISAETTISRCYDHAKDDAKTLATGKTFYTIGAFGSVDRMKTLTTDAGAPAKNYYAASDAEELQNALNAILNDIQTQGFGGASIEDGTTKGVIAESGTDMKGGMLEIADPSTYKYYLAFPIENNDGNLVSKISNVTNIESKGGDNYTLVGKDGKTFDVVRVPDIDESGNVKENSFKFEWKTSGNENNPLHTENPPAARLNDAKTSVIWDLNIDGDASTKDILLNDVTYTVSFDVWPSQVTLDLIADLKNAKVKYEDLDTDVQNSLKKVGDDYQLYTNTSAKLKYDDTRTETDESKDPVSYNNPEPVSTVSSEMMAVSKVFEDYMNPDTVQKDIDLYVDRGTLEKHYKIELKSPSFEKNVYISIGIMVVDESTGSISIKTPGHDYKFSEDIETAYNWELHGDTAHPMLINNVKTMLIKVDKPSAMTGDFYNENGTKYYKIEGSYYKATDVGTAKLTATNIRRGYMDVKKVVEGEDAKEDTLFTYTAKWTTGDSKDIWFSIWDGSNFVKNTSDTTYISNAIEGTGNDDGYYHAPSGTTVTIKLKAGWSLRFLNLPVDSTYEITELTGNDMPTNFQFKKVEGTKKIYTETNSNPDEVSEGTVSGSTISGTIGTNNTKYYVTYTNDYTKTHIDLKKVWEDVSDQDGIRPESVEVTVVGKIKDATGADVVVSRSKYNITKPTGQTENKNTWETTIDGLDRLSAGQEIVYSIESETAIDGYNTNDNEPAIDGLTVTNYHTPEVIDITVTKKWEDDNNRDQVRPGSVEVQLFAGSSSYGGAVTLSERNNWTYTYEGLDKNANGEEINYTVKELNTETQGNDEIIYGTDKESVYVVTITGDKDKGYTITNTHEVDKTEVTVTKKWEDDNNRDQVRPGSVEVQLYNGETAVGESITLSERNNWTHTFEDLIKNENGEEINYTVKELNTETRENDEVIYGTDGESVYVVTITGDKDKGYTITNTHEVDKTKVTVTKKWEDDNDRDRVRPGSVEVQLYNGENTVGESVTLSERNNWTHTFEDLIKNENGQAINYTVKELNTETKENDEVIYGTDGESVYVVTITGDKEQGYTITNTHEVDKTKVTVTKKWEDENNRDNVRLSSVEVQLYNGENTVGESVTLNADNNWTHTFEDLIKNENGQAINYTVKELNTETKENDEVIYGTDGESVYVVTVSGDKDKGYTITNTHTPNLINVTVIKDWEDDEDRDGIRPEELKVTLYNGEEAVGDSITLTAGDKWTAVFEGVPKFEAGSVGKLIEYNVKENEVPEGYTNTKDNKIEKDEKGNFTITVTNEHDNELTKVKVTKEWKDGENRDNSRPDSVEVQLYNGENTVGTPITLNADNNWTHVFEGLIKNESGEEITYTVKEVGTETDSEGKEVLNVVKGEKTYTYEVATSGDMSQGYKITNTYTPEVTSVTVTKDWQDASNQDRSRPENVSVELYADGISTKQIVVLSSGNNWTHTFENLDKNKDGQEINYTVKELGTEVDEEGVETLTVENNNKSYIYTVTISGENNSYTITNTYIPEVIELKVEKIWHDDNDRDRVRPGNITVILNADQDITEKGQKLVLSSNSTNDEGNWIGSFENLPKYHDGVEINYSLEELKVENYSEVKISEIVDGKITIENTHKISTIDIPVEKVWQDNNNEDSTRPGSITVYLYANGGSEAVDTATITPGEDGKWTHTFVGLPLNENGNRITYTVDEAPVDGYDKTVDGYVIYNSSNKTIPINGTKTWVDDNDRDRVRPGSITVRLYADGEEIDHRDVTAESVDSEGRWTYSFGDLPKYNKGQPILYTISEDVVDNYSTEIKNYDITNYHELATVDIVGTKDWEDDENRDKLRPESITINLYANGGSKPIDSTEVKPDEDGNWSFKFENKLKYENGEEITYTVDEVIVNGYENPDISDGEVSEEENQISFEIVNNHTPETITFNITKIWDDYEDEDGVRPESITIHLFADGKEIDSFEMTAENDWSYTSNVLPRYKKHDGTDKVEIVYTITEDEIEGYGSTIDEPVITIDETESKVINNSITNSHMPEITIEGEKIWEDFENKYNSRPDEITIYLYKKDELYKTIVVSSETDWKYVIENLDKYAGDEEITYTLKEEAVEGYETTYEGYNIINTIIWNEGDGELPPQTGIEVTYNNILYVIVSGLLFMMGAYLKKEESK